MGRVRWLPVGSAGSITAAILVVLMTAVVSSADASAGAPRISYATQGTAHQIVVSGTVRGGDGPKRVWLILQTRRPNGHSWQSRRKRRLALHKRSTHFRMVIRAGKRPQLLLVRVLVMSRNHLVARGPQRAVRAGDPPTVFYSGRGDAGAGDVGDNIIRLVASDQLLGLGPHYDGLWTGSSACDPTHAVPSVSAIGGDPISELAGFSLGRLGPIYFLLDNPSWTSQINYILLLDPGPLTEMQGGCDAELRATPPLTDTPTRLLEDWLSQDASHHLVVMAGPATVGDNYAGLIKYYLSAISPAQRSQVLVCQAGEPDHDSFLEDRHGGFGWMVGAPPPTQCPHGTSAPGVTLWPTQTGQPPTEPTSQPPTQPAPQATVALAQGPAAPDGYWYSIGLRGFAASSSVAVTCDDSVNPAGFLTFTLTTDASGSAAVANGCYSGSGPDHWVTADDVQSNHVTWQPASQPTPAVGVTPYDNYGSANSGIPMCRGNPGNTLSEPGGSLSETFTIPSGVANISAAKVQIDPDATVTAHATLLVDGAPAATDDQPASGDTNFTFSPVAVSAGDQLTLQISFSATYGKIITIYTAGAPGGQLSVSNACPDGAPTFTETSTGLRAVISGMSS